MNETKERAEAQRNGRMKRGFVQCQACEHFLINRGGVGDCLAHKNFKRFGFVWRKCEEYKEIK